MENLPAHKKSGTKVNLPQFRDKLENILNDCYADNIIEMDELENRLDLVQAAKSTADLDKIVEDLPGVYQNRYYQLTPDNQDKKGYLPTTSYKKLSAIMSEKIFRGGSLGASFTKVRSIMADCKIDLRNVNFPDNKTEIRLNCVMSDLTILVPENAMVSNEFRAIMCSHRESEDLNRSTSPGGPMIHITGNCVMADVKILTE